MPSDSRFPGRRGWLPAANALLLAILALWLACGRASRAFNQPFYLGGSASSVDHCALHPDPDVNEIWVSNMKGWETIVVGLDNYEVTDYIATPNGGDTHGMAFVWYDGGWDSGVLMGDMGGPKSAEMWQEVANRVAADATE